MACRPFETELPDPRDSAWPVVRLSRTFFAVSVRRMEFHSLRANTCAAQTPPHKERQHAKPQSTLICGGGPQMLVLAQADKHIRLVCFGGKPPSMHSDSRASAANLIFSASWDNMRGEAFLRGEGVSPSSHSYGHDPGVSALTGGSGPNCLLGKVAPFLSSWCAEGAVPQGRTSTGGLCRRVRSCRSESDGIFLMCQHVGCLVLDVKAQATQRTTRS